MSNLKEEFEDTKGVMRIRKSKKNKQHNGGKKNKEQKNKQRSTKPKIEQHEPHYNPRWTRVLWKGKQSLLHWWRQSCC